MEINAADLLNLITKGGVPAIIMALLYGLSLLVREVKGGKVAGDEKAVLTAQIADITARLSKVEAELDAAWDLVHSMRYQRDQARLQAERLGYDARLWPPEPNAPALSNVANPYPTAPAAPLPPLLPAPDGGPK